MAEITDRLNEFMSQLDLSEEMARKLLEGGRITTLQRGESIIKQNELCRYVIVTLNGVLQVSICRPDGQEYLLGYSFAIAFVTDYPAFLNQSAAHYTIQATNDVTVLLLPYEHVMNFYEYNMETQRFGRKIAEWLMTEREDRMLSFHIDTPEERYLKMLELCKDLDKQISLKDIASMIGVTPETVSRIRKKILLNSKS